MFKVRNNFEVIPTVDGLHIQNEPQEKLFFLHIALLVGP
jgi:hypothetical protein